MGFSPGFAGIVTFADGSRLFLKVMSGTRDPWSIEFNRREAAVLASLPESVAAPRLQWTFEDDEWLIIAVEAVDGDHVRPASDPAHAQAMWDVFSRLAEVPAPSGLVPFHEYLHDLFNRWQTLAEAPDRDARLASLGDERAWIESHLDVLVEWERAGIDASKGDALVHGDLRADNALITADGIVVVDWPHATRGAPWLDLLGYLPSYEMYGGGSARDAFRAHPLARGVSETAERAMVAAVAGYLVVESTEPPMPALPGIREFQRAQALPALNWLRQLA